jgi:hypothetical protein
MVTLYTSTIKTDEENAQEAIKVFPLLNDTSAMNLVLWLKERPSMNGIIDESELDTLKGVVWQ